jgi:predicted DNA-binding protein YlxM (UPF0122 family)
VATEYRINKKLEVSLSHKMLDEFEKISLTTLVKIVLEKYINSDFSLSGEEINKFYKNSNRNMRKNIYNVDALVKDFDDKLEERVNFNTNRKRSAAIEVSLNKWLNGEYEISREKFLQKYKK